MGFGKGFGSCFNGATLEELKNNRVLFGRQPDGAVVLLRPQRGGRGFTLAGRLPFRLAPGQVLNKRQFLEMMGGLSLDEADPAAEILVDAGMRAGFICDPALQEAFLKHLMHVKGAVKGQLFNARGELKYEHTSYNLVVTNGLQHVARRLIANDTSGLGDIIDRMAIGDDNTPAEASQTNLQGSQLAAQAFDMDYPSRSGAIVSFKTTYAAGTGTVTPPQTVCEAALFNNAMTGTVNVDYFMLARAVIGPYSKGAGDTLALTWTWTIS